MKTTKIKTIIGIILLFGSRLICFSQTLPINESEYEEKIRVACIGNSVTYGAGIENREWYAYPVQLQKMLGNNYEVVNFGFSGATMLKKGHKPYWETQLFHEAVNFAPHVVIIHLGLNDTDPRNWPNYSDEFIRDYEAMIDLFSAIEITPKPKVWICRLSPIFSWHRRFKTGTREYFREIQEAIEQVAINKGVTIIDLHSPLYKRPDLFPDSVHPLAEGANVIAETVKNVITGKFGGLKVARVFSNHMVLQRELPIKIWGTADFNEKIIVILGRNSAECTTGTDGKWDIELPLMPAGGPYALIISGKTTLEFNDVLIGEVWLCSGQSNMAFPLKSEKNGAVELPDANFPEIRLFNMKTIAWAGNVAFSEEQLNKINRGEFYKFGPWKNCTTETASEFSAVAYYFGKKIHNELGVPIGLIHNAKGGSNTESWVSRTILESHPWLVDMLTDWRNNDLVSEWCRERASKNLEGTDNPLQRHPFEPSYLFDAGIAPLIPFGIKGVIWYQGESNAENIPVHNELFPMLVNDWRDKWGIGDFSFLYVQLSSIEPRNSWPEFRDSQRRFLDIIPGCGMAVTSDIGHPTDVHPKNKKDVGNRLALWALAQTYNRDITYSGPLYKSLFTRKSKIWLSFDHCGTGLATKDNKKITGFEIAGTDRNFKPAKARIKGKHIIIHNKEIKNPVAVRYNWKPYTEGNLFNKEGLPASTFNTEEKK